MKKRGIIQRCGEDRRVQLGAAFQEARGAKYQVEMQSTMPGKIGGEMCSCPWLCSGSAGHRALSKAKMSWRWHGDDSRGPVFPRVFLIFLLSGFEHLKVKAAVVSQMSCLCLNQELGKSQGHFQAKNRYLMIPGCDPDTHRQVSTAIHDALRSHLPVQKAMDFTFAISVLETLPGPLGTSGRSGHLCLCD